MSKLETLSGKREENFIPSWAISYSLSHPQKAKTNIPFLLIRIFLISLSILLLKGLFNA